MNSQYGRRRRALESGKESEAGRKKKLIRLLLTPLEQMNQLLSK
ncbi:MAG: hypothetical protein AABX02_00840 [archaeon]